MRLNFDTFNELSSKQKLLTCCIGFFIICAIIGSVMPDNSNTSTDNTVKPQEYINITDFDMVNGKNNPYKETTKENTSTENVMTTLSDRNIYATCANGVHGANYAFNLEQVQMLAYYSNNTFNFTKLGVSYHDEDQYKVVDHIFFENGTEMTMPSSGVNSISEIINKGMSHRGNGHISNMFGMSEQESIDYLSSN